MLFHSKDRERAAENSLMRRGFLTLPLLAALLFTGCSSLGAVNEEPVQSDLFAMDTYMTFTAYGDGAEQALADVEERIKELEGEWSVTDEGSEIYRVNHSGGAPVELGADTAGIVSFALEMAEETGGALDPTIYPVLTAWGFTTDENRIPSQEEIDSLLEHVGYEKVEMSGNQISLPEGMEIDLGAVGKGYAGDLAAEIIREKGITSALLDIGGNIQAVGSRPGGGDWRLGIQNPFGDGQIGLLTVSDCAVVTSGNYERYFIGEDGKRYCHIIDPKTGYPVDNGLASVTVITEEGRRGDALSTALFVMGAEEAENYWRDNSGFELIIITEEGKVLITEGVSDQFTLGSSFSNMEVSVISR
ncbi:FAD:protein FMN transferase [Lachnoclostridium sp. An169]|uniref:FAD:protein FMN transferase n=1 Tax=Lachnoclostridium sp. An169 TaxID=1965569 RepID=UPI001FA8AA6A|nr:FAD:protein FMN transferase [Lachnoclostridium sp. An169]